MPQTIFVRSKGGAFGVFRKMLHPPPQDSAPEGVQMALVRAQSFTPRSSKGAQHTPLPPDPIGAPRYRL